MIEKGIIEEEMQDPGYVSNATLNNDISPREIEKCVRKLKLKKAVGPEYIPNEVLKTGKLNNVFQNCFKNGLGI